MSSTINMCYKISSRGDNVQYILLQFYPLVHLIIVTCQLVGSLTSNSTVQINHHGIGWISTLLSHEIMDQWEALAYAFN